MNNDSPRSFLYVPADQDDKLHKAVNRGADAILIDLEDSVSSENKKKARKNLVNFLNNYDLQTEIWVRVNNDPHLLVEDLLVAVHPKVAGISIPKSDSAEQLLEVANEITKLEKISGSANIKMLALIESARGVFAAVDIALVPRVSMLQLGEQDLRHELRLPPDFSHSPLDYARNAIIYASAIAEIHQPLGSVVTQFSDLISFRESTEAIRRQGFFGRTCIHPSQVSIVNDVFSKNEEEVKKARRIVEIMEYSTRGANVDDDGKMIDEAHLKWAKSILGN